MKKRNLLLSVALFVLLVAFLMWLTAPRTATSPTQVTTVTPALLPQLVQQDYPDMAATGPATSNSPLPSLEGGAATAAAIDKLPPEKLRAGMDAYLANYPKEATEYALRKVRENPETRIPSLTLIYANAVCYALAKTDRVALAEYLAALPDNVRPMAAYAATARYINDGDLESAVASLTPASEQGTIMRVADLYAERDPQAAAEWAQQYQGTHNYEIAIMSVVRAYAKTDAVKARQWLSAMPAGSNQQTLLAELDSAPR